MKKVMLWLTLLWVCGGPAMAGTSYSLSGKVYNSHTGLPVSGAMVTHTIYWSPGTTYGSTISASDGSFSFNLTSDSWDFKGVTMSLKAASNFCSGSTTWTCSSYAETKDVWISCSLMINPNLSVVVMPGHFVVPGPQPPVTAVAFLDQPEPPVFVKQFMVKLAWNPAQMNLMMVENAPDSQFEITQWSSIPGSGEAIVNGRARFNPVPIREVPFPAESFFDVFFEVIVPPEELPVAATVTVIPEETVLFDGGGLYSYPYQHQTDFLLGVPEGCKPAFLMDSFEEWKDALAGERPGSNIRPATVRGWEQYMAYWHDPMTEKEGEPYPKTTFVPPCEVEPGFLGGRLYVWPGGGGGGGGAVEDAGLVMAWEHSPEREGNYASAWRYDYGMDPDLSNCTIQVTVTPPAPPAGGQSHINAVSFSIVDAANRMRTWWWAVPAAIPLGVPTTVTINTAIPGIGAATPPATGYMNVPGFNITQSQFFDVDENFQYIFGPQPVPPPGQPQFVGAWNYWHNLIVTKNTKAYKGTWPKWTQGPDVLNPDSDVPQINGWDEVSVYEPPQWPIMADDWLCTDDRPITDLHWWGSFIGWTQPHLPPVLPKAFHLGIWTDVPVGPTVSFSHPGKMVWEHVCDNWVWNFAGYDIDPRIDQAGHQKNEACFQFNQLLSEDDWFYQEPGGPEGRVYWLSISAIYDPQDWPKIRHPWGWKTRPKFFNDDAVRIMMTADGLWPPKLGAAWGSGNPVEFPLGVSWDLAFELTTNVKPACHTLEADINHDCIVNLLDLQILAQQWLLASP